MSAKLPSLSRPQPLFSYTRTRERDKNRMHGLLDVRPIYVAGIAIEGQLRVDAYARYDYARSLVSRADRLRIHRRAIRKVRQDIRTQRHIVTQGRFRLERSRQTRRDVLR